MDRPGLLADPAAVAVVVAAARAALAVERGEASPRDPRWDSASVDDIVRAVRLHRVGSLLLASPGALAMPDDVAAALRGVNRAETLAGLRLAGQSVRAVDAVRSAGLPVLLFKGVALAAQSAGTLTARGSGDIDLLVRPADVGVTHDVLTAGGWVGDPLPPPGRWRQRYLAARRERSYVAPASPIDLHWRIGWHDRPLPDAQVLLDRADVVVIADRPVPTLALPDAFAAACYHAAVDRYARLRLLVDVARLVARPETRLPGDAHWRLRRLVAEAVTLAGSLLGPLPGAERFAPPGRIDPASVLALWRSASVRQEWLAADTSFSELVAVYRDSARFAGVPAALGMAVTDALVPPERIRAGMGPMAVAVAVAGEVGDLVRRRVLPTAATRAS